MRKGDTGQLGPGSVSGSGHFAGGFRCTLCRAHTETVAQRFAAQGQSTVVLGALMAQRLRDEDIPSDRITVIENWADGEVIQPVLQGGQSAAARMGLGRKIRPGIFRQYGTRA